MRWAINCGEWNPFKRAADLVVKFLRNWLPEFKFQVKGRLALDAQWKEWKDHRCFYAIDGHIDANPLLGVAGRIPFGPLAALPAFVKKFGDVYLFVEFWGQLNLRGHWARVSPDDDKKYLEGMGQIGAKVGASLHLMSKNVLQAEADGRTYIQLNAKPDYKSDKPKAMVELVWKGLRLVLTVKVCYGWIERRHDLMLIEEKQLWKNHPLEFLRD